MLPGMGGFEVVVIALLALVIVGPKDLPILMRRLARWVNHVRGMAAEFRSSFDEMARQSELDELRREVEALRRGEPLAPLRAEIDPTFQDIHTNLHGDGATVAAEPYLPSLEPAGVAPEEPYLPSLEPHTVAAEPDLPLAPPPEPKPPEASPLADAAAPEPASTALLPEKPARARKPRAATIETASAHEGEA